MNALNLLHVTLDFRTVSVVVINFLQTTFYK
jgi:hypothetical protein